MPFHPSTVHFPVAFLFMAGALFLWHALKKESWLPKAGNVLLLAGLGGLLVAILSGRQAESEIIPRENVLVLLENHETIGYVLLAIFPAFWIWQYVRRGKLAKVEEWIFIILYAGLLGLMTYGSHLGARMVYEEGAGVIPVEQQMEAGEP